MKGGYKIIDFKNVSLSGTPVTMTDVLVDLLNNYEKVVLLSHVVLSGSAKDDCFSTVLSDGAGGVKLNCYDGYISINSSGAVTYTVASASGMASDIADINNMIAPAWSATATYTRNSIVRSNGNLYLAKQDVPTGTSTSNTTYWENIILTSKLSDLIIIRQFSTNFTANAGEQKVLYLRDFNYGSIDEYQTVGFIRYMLGNEKLTVRGIQIPNDPCVIIYNPTNNDISSSMSVMVLYVKESFFKLYQS